MELVRTLIRENPGKYILSEKFSQDPLEQALWETQAKWWTLL